jgi:hypothetical protein
MTADEAKPWRLLAQTSTAGARAVAWVQTLAALGSALAFVWQRLMFDRVLGVPPPLLAWVFWLLFTLSLLLHLRFGEGAERALACLSLAAAADYLWILGLPELGPGPELEELRWRLASWLSTLYWGLPTHALLAAAGVLAWAWLCTQSTQRPFVALASGAVVLLFGATTVLGYATGSPWPFGV